MRKRVWLSYDLGIKGDYDSIYTWLADHGARECGDSLASFQYDFDGEEYGEELLQDIQRSVELRVRDRLYLIWYDEGVRGSFIHGSRKSSPWTGYGSGEPGEDK